MKVVKQAEDTLSGLFKDMPKMPENSRESLARAFPWIALIFGVLQLAAAYWLWKLTTAVAVLNDYVNQFNQYYTGAPVGLSAADKTVIYLAVATLLIDAIILLMAYPKLKARQKSGWDLLFLGSLINVLYALITIFVDGRGFGTFLINLLGSAIGFYLLFQVRDKFKSVQRSKPKA